MAEPGAPVACPNCAYALEGLHSLKCPECGYVPEPEELAGAERRKVFYELTRWSQFGWLLHVGMISLVMQAMQPFGPALYVVGGVVLYLLPGFVVGQWAVARRVPLAYRPLVRRMWRQNLVWMQLPWFVVAVGFLGCGLITVLMRAGGRDDVADAVADFLWAGYMRRPNVMVVLPLGLVGLVAAPFVWRWRWGRLVKISGLPSRTREQVSVWLAMRAALVPALLIFLVPAVLAGMLAGADWLFPNWWRHS